MPGPPSKAAFAGLVTVTLVCSVSSPPWPANVATSLASPPATNTSVPGPVTRSAAPDELMPALSASSVPLTTTLSAAASPAPSNPARLTSVRVMPALPRSSTVTVSVPPRARTLTPSMPSRSMSMAATSRVSRAPVAPLEASSIFSLALEPLKASVSEPASPSTTSEPSPGSHWKVSLPGPSLALSAPMLPSTRSLPLPPKNCSAPLPPSSVSLPLPPSTLTLGSGVAALRMRTESVPPPASTWTELNALRANVKSAVPSAPTSSTTASGVGAITRSSLALLPTTRSVPPASTAAV